MRKPWPAVTIGVLGLLLVMREDEVLERMDQLIEELDSE